jgi:hypothetical protein
MCSRIERLHYAVSEKPGENRKGASRRHEAIRHDLLRLSVNTKKVASLMNDLLPGSTVTSLQVRHRFR